MLTAEAEGGSSISVKLFFKVVKPVNENISPTIISPAEELPDPDIIIQPEVVCSNQIKFKPSSNR
jgi:hypothetical protein